MKNNTENLQNLLDRLNRLVSSENWADDLNPAQRTTLRYLARANRFSRAPSHVADYLCTTRGTASQTLKALERKNLISRQISEEDKRSIRYDLTPIGLETVAHGSQEMSQLRQTLSDKIDVLENMLLDILKIKLQQNGLKSFGMCQTCNHHQHINGQNFCSLLNVELTDSENTQICHEHTA